MIYTVAIERTQIQIRACIIDMKVLGIRAEQRVCDDRCEGEDQA